MLPSSLSELNAALLQAIVTLGVAALCAVLYAQFRKRYFLWWAVAWGVYVLRIGAIVAFLLTTHEAWLYVHQVLTGWTALVLLGAALVFSQQIEWRPWYLALVLFPPLWSYVAIYRLEHFLLAAGPAVAFLSLATMWTGWVFLRMRRRTGSPAAAVLAGIFFLWGLHHLDYPLLRAQGAWNPWGYYLDIGFVLALAASILMLVIEDLRRGLSTLSALSGDLQSRAEQLDESGAVIDSLLVRPLALGGVRGSALYLTSGGDAGAGRFVRGVAACADWTGRSPAGAVWERLTASIESGRPEIARDWPDPFRPAAPPFAYAAALPVIRAGAPVGALVVVGEQGDPFTALGEEFLRTLGRQVGTALERADLTARLAVRTRELERLSARMLRQQEEERRRIALELHDETAQAFAAVKLQLGVLRESAPPELAPKLDRVLELVDAGMRSIRNVTRDLRPPLLDELGLLPALRALVGGFADGTSLAVAFEAPAALPPLADDAELALFRALQEALSNVARHAGARSVRVSLRLIGGVLELEVRDDGRGAAAAGARDADRTAATNGSGAPAGLGLAGMRERFGAIGGTVDIGAAPEGGLRLAARLPVAEAGTTRGGAR